MRPEDGFSKRSRKRYKALRKALVNVTVPEGWYVIPGRQRDDSVLSDTVYVQVGYRTPGLVKGHTRHVFRRFYFSSKPKPKEVKQIVRLIVENMEGRRYHG